MTPVDDHATGDRARPRHPERGADLGLTDRRSLQLGTEQTLGRVLDVLDGLVDDPVGADVDAVLLGERRACRVLDDVEPDDDRVRSLGKRDVVLGDATDALAQDVDLDQ